MPARAERAMRTAITIDTTVEMIGLKRPRLIQLKQNKFTSTVGNTSKYRSDVFSILMTLKPVSKQTTGASIIARLKNGLMSQ
jgi:SH3-like domain-containing protein